MYLSILRGLVLSSESYFLHSLICFFALLKNQFDHFGNYILIICSFLNILLQVREHITFSPLLKITEIISDLEQGRE